jgi:hypothetical protein
MIDEISTKRSDTMDAHHLARLEAKTASQQFTRMLQQDFNLAPKIAQVIVQEAELFLNQQQQPLKVGQIRVVLAQRHVYCSDTSTLVDVRGHRDRTNFLGVSAVALPKHDDVGYPL